MEELTLRNGLSWKEIITLLENDQEMEARIMQPLYELSNSYQDLQEILARLPVNHCVLPIGREATASTTEASSYLAKAENDVEILSETFKKPNNGPQERDICKQDMEPKSEICETDPGVSTIEAFSDLPRAKYYVEILSETVNKPNNGPQETDIPIQDMEPHAEIYVTNPDVSTIETSSDLPRAETDVEIMSATVMKPNNGHQDSDILTQTMKPQPEICEAGPDVQILYDSYHNQKKRLLERDFFSHVNTDVVIKCLNTPVRKCVGFKEKVMCLG